MMFRVISRVIQLGATDRQPQQLDTTDFPSLLMQARATFVTLHIAGQLRGCVGVLEPVRPLMEDLAANAFAAAFRDTRFTPVRAEEVDQLTKHISILTPATVLRVQSNDELLAAIRPNFDGLILEDGVHRATFLPAVWTSLPAAEDFVRQLKRKAGLDDNHWSPRMECRIYQAIESPDDLS